MDLQQELLRDWDDDWASEAEVEARAPDASPEPKAAFETSPKSTEAPAAHHDIAAANTTTHTKTTFQGSLVDHIRRLLAKRHQHNIRTASIIEEIEIFALLPQLREQLDRFRQGNSDYMDLLSAVGGTQDNEEHQFVLAINDLATLINDEVRFLHSFVRLHYKVVFPELETVVASAVDYAKAVLVLKQDLALVRERQEELAGFLSGEKILLLTMAAVLSKPRFRLEQHDLQQVADGCVMMVELTTFLDDARAYIAQRVQLMSPNLAGLVGPVTASQLLVATGSLRQLAATPACNLAALGVHEYADTDRQAMAGSIRQTGYLFHCELVHYLPLEVVKQAMRIVSAKVVLCARLDVAGSSPDGSMGAQYRQELHTKIDKLLTPPENRGDKALPVPVDPKLKKRGGRRFRKMKERFQMSEMRRAQNRMEFGKAEDTVMDGYGNEIGLGMAAKETAAVNENTGARMSKRMAERVGGGAAKRRKNG